MSQTLLSVWSVITESGMMADGITALLKYLFFIKKCQKLVFFSVCDHCEVWGIIMALLEILIFPSKKCQKLFFLCVTTVRQSGKMALLLSDTQCQLQPSFPQKCFLIWFVLRQFFTKCVKCDMLRQNVSLNHVFVMPDHAEKNSAYAHYMTCGVASLTSNESPCFLKYILETRVNIPSVLLTKSEEMDIWMHRCENKMKTWNLAATQKCEWEWAKRGHECPHFWQIHTLMVHFWSQQSDFEAILWDSYIRFSWSRWTEKSKSSTFLQFNKSYQFFSFESR